MKRIYFFAAVALALVGTACTKQNANVQNFIGNASVPPTNASTNIATENPDTVTVFLTADVLPLDKVGKISKFRSGSGHDYSDGTETCRSMKHYIDPKTRKFLNREELLSSTYPANVPVYSPATGVISEIQEEQYPLGKQIHVTPDGTPSYTVRLFHIFPLASLQVGERVTAGQQVGTIKAVQGFDVAIEKRGDRRPTYHSMFDFMSAEQLSAWKAKGITPEIAVYTKEYRDAHPFTCNGQTFSHTREIPADWVELKT